MGVAPYQKEEAGRADAARVCHQEQLDIWSSEMAECLQDFLREPPDYDGVIALHSALQNAIKDLVEKAFTHPELTD